MEADLEFKKTNKKPPNKQTKEKNAPKGVEVNFENKFITRINFLYIAITLLANVPIMVNVRK